MIGMVTSAVRDTITNAMLRTKLAAIAINDSACQVLFARSNMMTGKASVTAHSANSWLWSM